MKSESRVKTREAHCITIFVSFETKERLKKLAEKLDRTTADIVRAVIKLGIPVMEGISEAEETMIKEYVVLFRKFRKMKTIKEL